MEQSDTESRIRIRDAALRQFAALGFKGATIRGIAQRAGVSPGRVQHHFPSKQALRDECDAHVLSFLRASLREGAAGALVTETSFVADTHRAVALVVPYVAVSLIGDGPDAQRWFDELAELHGGFLTGGELGVTLPEGADVPAIVAVHTAMQLGLAILAGHVYRRLDADGSDAAATARIGRARLFLATRRLIGEELAADVRDGLDRYQREDEGTDEG